MPTFTAMEYVHRKKEGKYAGRTKQSADVINIIKHLQKIQIKSDGSLIDNEAHYDP